MKRDVSLKITSAQYVESLEPSGEAFLRKLELEDSVEVLTSGTMYDKENALYITYDESKELAAEDVKTVLKLTTNDKGNKVFTIRRYGQSDDEDMDMILQQGIRNITRYKIPQVGSLDIEVYTVSLTDEFDEDGYGKISVDYRLKFDQFYSRRNKLEVEIKPQ